MIRRVKIPQLARPDPQIPVHPRRHCLRLRRLRQQGRIPSFRADPRIDLPHLADRAGVEMLDGLADAHRRVPLIAELGRHARLLRDPRDLPRLPNIMRERLLTIHVLPCPHRPDRHIRMQMIRRRTQDRIDALFLFEHHAEVLIARAPIARGHLAVVIIDDLQRRQPTADSFVIIFLETERLRRVRDRDHLGVGLREQRTEILRPAPTHADHRERDFLARRHEPRPTEHMTRQDLKRRDRRRRRLEEMPPRRGVDLHAPQRERIA